ncbi:virulence RhuM family protein [Hymenobacter sp. BRD128]|uniref:virulence RhuM family protein n=1 Tax=Hymenobacter sp. BRD128 TaxID=2675878 RepID=UPI001563C3DB|nr:RhuM family protein [Hymenobacter sp. BRD128]QKG56951.1 virulence RhuM family protein [Hymenobacter sp. BRD128]
MSPATTDVLLYQSPDGQMQLDVQLDHDTVWLTQAQMSKLFETTKQNVSLHVRNLFKENELAAKAVIKESLTTAADGKSYRTNYYNLDVIISVGYRVKSKRGTSFRQWATQVLRQYLVQGYALNEKRLRESQRQLADLKRLVQLQAEVASSQELTADQSDALLRILGDYARALDVLDQYDHQRLRVARDTVAPAAAAGFELTYESALQAGDAGSQSH